MGFCEVGDEDLLPRLWKELAKTMKKNDLTVIQDQIIKYPVGPAKFIQATPIVLLQLAQDLVTFMFHAHSSDNVKTGLHPFIIVDRTEAH